MIKKTKVLSLTALILVGCSKDRPVECAQGYCSGDLFPIGEVSRLNKSGGYVKTGNILYRSNLLSNAQDVHLDGSFEQMNAFHLVEVVDTDSDYIEGIPFRGKENHSYGLHYELTKDYFIVYKTGAKADMPSQEWTVGKFLNDRTFAVPLVAYNINLINLDYRDDANYEDTTQLFEYSTKNLAEANHFRLDPTNRRLFSIQDKRDVLPADLFDEDVHWYYSASIVSAGITNTGWLGVQLNVDDSGQNISRIRFEKRRESIAAINANIDEQIKVEEFSDGFSAFEIPVTWLEYDIEEIGREAVIREIVKKEDTTGNRVSRNWKDKKYVKVDFNGIKHPYGLSYIGSLPSEFYALNIYKDYISFIISYPGLNIRVKYSLLKAHDPVKGKNYCSYDKNLFGFFQSKKNYIRRYERTGSEYCQYNFLNRFYPKADVDGTSKIVFNFMEGSSENLKYRQAAVDAVAEWNETMKEALKGSGRSVEVVMDTVKEIPIGDIRHNGIYIGERKSFNSNSALGHASSLADMKSGEIISASSYVHIEEMKNSLIQNIRNYISYSAGIFEDSAAQGHSGISPLISDDVMMRFYESIPFELTANEDRLPLSPYNGQFRQYKAHYQDKMGYFLSDQIDQIRSKKSYYDLPAHEDGRIYNLAEGSNPETGANVFHNFNYIDSSFGSIFGRIENQCPFLKGYAEEMTLESLRTEETEEELKVYARCVEKLLPDSIKAFLLRNIGHNLGLTLNPAASTDSDNFSVGKDGKKTRSSSVMDYLVEETDGLMLSPGLYDVAALRFAYGNQIEIMNDDDQAEIISIDENKPLKEQVISKEESSRIATDTGRRILKNYKYCSISDTFRTESSCMLFDSGSTIEERVDNIIADYWSRRVMEGHYYDIKAMGVISRQVGQRNVSETFIPLRLIYEEWRYNLRKLAQHDQYLEREHGTFDSYNQLLTHMKDHEQYGKIYERYYNASRKIFKFFKDVLSTPPRHCVVAKNDGVEYLEFEDLQQVIFSNTGETIHDCDSPAAMNYYESSGLVFEDSVGEFYNDIVKSLTTKDVIDPLFIHLGTTTMAAGMASDRFLATVILTQRMSLLEKSQKEEFAPNFIDEIEFRCEMEEFIYARVFKGLDTRHFQRSEVSSAPRSGDQSDCNTLERIGLKVREEAVQDTQLKTSFAFQGIETDGDTHKILLEFDREKMLYTFALNAFIGGLEVPNNNLVSAERKKKYRVFTSPFLFRVTEEVDPDPNNARNFDKIGPIYVGVEKENKEAFLLLDKRKVIKSVSVNSPNNKQILINEEDSERLFAIVRNTPLPAGDKLRQITLGGLIEVSDRINEYYKENILESSFSPLVKNIIKKWLHGYLAFSLDSYEELDAFKRGFFENHPRFPSDILETSVADYPGEWTEKILVQPEDVTDERLLYLRALHSLASIPVFEQYLEQQFYKVRSSPDREESELLKEIGATFFSFGSYFPTEEELNEITVGEMYKYFEKFKESSEIESLGESPTASKYVGELFNKVCEQEYSFYCEDQDPSNFLRKIQLNLKINLADVVISDDILNLPLESLESAQFPLEKITTMWGVPTKDVLVELTGSLFADQLRDFAEQAEIQGQEELNDSEFIAFYDAIPALSIEELRKSTFGEMLEMIKDIEDYVDDYEGPLKDLLKKILVSPHFSSNIALISFLQSLQPNAPADSLYTLVATEESMFMNAVRYELSDKFLDLKLSDIVKSEDKELISNVFPLAYEHIRPGFTAAIYSELSAGNFSTDAQRQVADFFENFPFINVDEVLDFTIREIIEKNQKMIDVFQNYSFDDPAVKKILLPLLAGSLQWTQMGDSFVEAIRNRMNHFEFDLSIFDNGDIVEDVILDEEIASKKYLQEITSGPLSDDQRNEILNKILSRERYESALNTYLIDKNFVIDHEDNDLIVEEYLLRSQDYNAQMDIINLFLLSN